MKHLKKTTTWEWITLQLVFSERELAAARNEHALNEARRDVTGFSYLIVPDLKLWGIECVIR